jgi:hypothetical protein
MSQIIEKCTAETLRFQKPINGGSPNTYRIPVSGCKDGRPFPSVFIATPTVFSFGVTPQANIGEKVEEDLSNVKSYTLPLCLYNKAGPAPEEVQFVELFNSIVEACKVYLCTKEVNEQLAKFGDDQLQMSDLKRLNPLYYKKVKGVIEPGTGPVLYAKLLMQKDAKRCFASFTDDKNTHNDFKSLINKRMYVRCALKLDSIFVGAKVSLQFKVFEVNYKLLNVNGPSRLLADLPVQCGGNDEQHDDDTIHD